MPTPIANLHPLTNCELLQQDLELIESSPQLHRYHTADGAYIALLNYVNLVGHKSAPKGNDTVEVLGYHTSFNMNYPLISLKQRNINYKFMIGEAGWILSGDNTVAYIEKFLSRYKSYSDDGVYLFGAYGPEYVRQVPFIIDAFKEDLHTRQAVLTLWKQNPRASRDIPCTVSLQFMVRDGKLHCFVSMRSSDSYLGIPYDWFTFSMIANHVNLLILQCVGVNLDLGNLFFTASSQHIYSRDLKKINEILSILSSPNYATLSDYVHEDYERINASDTSWLAVSPTNFVERFKIDPNTQLDMREAVNTVIGQTL